MRFRDSYKSVSQSCHGERRLTSHFTDLLARIGLLAIPRVEKSCRGRIRLTSRIGDLLLRVGMLTILLSRSHVSWLGVAFKCMFRL